MISNKGLKINKGWEYKINETAAPVIVELPHTNKEVPYHYFDEKDYQFISFYKRNISVGKDAKRVFLKFDGVMTAFTLFINEKEVAEYKGGYIPHFIEITEYVLKGADNEVAVKVDSTEREDIPPFGFIIDYLTYGGIYRDVYLYELEPCFIENIFYTYCIEALEGVKGNVKVTPKIVINNADQKQNYIVKVALANQVVVTELTVEEGKNTYLLNEISLVDIDLWDIESPSLYEVKVSLYQVEELLDEATTKVGFRKLEITPDGLYLNNKEIKILGLNRHQAYPYVGYAMPKRVQEKDADILKYELGLNTARTSHYPQSPYFLNRCDEIGLLVLEEVPGWQHISENEVWRAQVLKDVEGMINRDYNHPSIITWGVRINESIDDEDLYKKTNALARKLDNSRFTSGVRCYEKSQLLEDIYTMNDFIHTGGEKILRTREEVTGLSQPVPYLVTEFCGHMFPTKKFDQEERLVEHAIRHGRIQSKARSNKDYLGAIGWCAFDYNTHYDFGSGDRICYHGVMDMFRIPKYAAHLYQSQIDPKIKPVIEPLTYWTRGERDGGVVFPIYVCTNCEKIEVIFDGKSQGVFTRTEETIDEKLAGLLYPPIKLNLHNGDWGSAWIDATFVGYIDDQVVVKKEFCANPKVEDIAVIADDTRLNGDEFDATRVIVKVVDSVGNTLPYATGVITVEATEGLEVIGPKQLVPIGGSIAFWVKTNGVGNESSATIIVNSSFGIEKKVAIQIEKA